MTLQQFKSLRWADTLFYALFEPRSMYRRIKEPSFSIYLTFLIPALISISEIVTFYLLKGGGTLVYYGFTYGWILNFIFFSVMIIITASLVDMASQFAGFAGNIKHIISIINISLFPKIFLMPIVYIFSVIGFAPLFFYCLASLGLFVYSSFIAVLNISEMNGAGFGKSLLVYIFPCLFFILTGFFVFLLLLLGFFQLLFT